VQQFRGGWHEPQLIIRAAILHRPLINFTMYITDLNGKKTEITNLHAAIDQATTFVGYFTTDERFKDFEEIQKEYWRDILSKLRLLADLN
jgi:hypothetical protein